MRERRIVAPPGWDPDPKRATTRNELAEILTILSKPGWLFRGESRYFESGMSSLGRYLRPNADSPLAAECVAIQWFRHCVHPCLTDKERTIANNMFGVLMLMQHYGAPTRLLDWTGSPWIAAYHASSCDPGEDGILWGFEPNAFYERVPKVEWTKAMGTAIEAVRIEDYQRFLSSCPECVLPIGGLECTDRMLAQQGTFTLGHGARIDHRVMVGRHCAGCAGSTTIVVIPKEIKRELMHLLFLMNITGSSLFPGLDGVGRGLREMAQFAINVPQYLTDFSRDQSTNRKPMRAAENPVGGPI